jgi:formylglycine-generating enzyme required for sulfatase activity
LQARLTTLNSINQRLAIPDLVQITSSICGAVAYAHQRGMIHRDLKPANVMLNTQGQPILMDFGVAKMLGDSHQTATGSVVGTALYMSPEQARGERPDERSDIYSIGIMLFEMITGSPPFKADSAVSLMMKHVTQAVPDIRQLNQDVPDLLVAVTKKALAKEPNERYRTASDMALALRATDLPDRTGVGVPARTRTGSEAIPLSSSSGSFSPVAGSAIRPARKLNPLIWIMGGAALMVLLGIGLGLFWLFNRPAKTPTPEPQAQLPPAQGMVRIEAGSYTVGRDTPGQNYAPTQEVKLAEFWIDEYEVTNAQYAKFLADSKQPAPATWSAGNFPEGKEDFPVQGVTWEMAAAYCAWINKRLPNEAEWEVTARGPEGRLFPWGNDQKAVVLPQTGTYQVGSKLTNQSAFGVFDLAGNVWEWVGETYAPIAAGNKLLRGGENGFLKDMAYRLIGPPDQESMIRTAGMRCAADQVTGVEQPAAKVEGVLSQDDFANPSSGWPILSEGTFLYGYHPPDYYHVEVGRPDSHTVVSRRPNLENMRVEAAVLVDHTTTETGTFRYGLAVRRTGDDYYAFTVSPRAGTWQALKSSVKGFEVLGEGQVSSLQGFAPRGFTPDKTDALQVEAIGSKLIFSINSQAVAEVSDSDYSSGEVGFFVQNFDESLAHIHYDMLTVHDISESAQASTAPTDVSATPQVTPEASPTDAPEVALAPTASPTQSPTIAPTPTDTPEAPTATPKPATATPKPATATPISIPQDVVLVPAGYFQLGSSTGQANEQPEHPAFVDAFFLDQFEASNAQYRQCVADGACTPGNKTDSFTYQGYRDNPTYDNYPVVGVSWNQADAYCRWAGKRLPSEAEWEYAASGPQNLTWPWGNTFDVSLAAASAADTQPVDSYPDGVSPFGVYNMAGNVAEWVADMFDENFYGNSPALNPVNTGSGTGRIFRGGSFGNPDGSFYTTSRRYGNASSFNDVDIGFRCARDAAQVTPPEEREALINEFCQVFAAYKPEATCP